jgi:hypothetical protein
LRVVTDRSKMRIISIQGGQQLPLRTCRQDPNLPKILSLSETLKFIPGV